MDCHGILRCGVCVGHHQIAQQNGIRKTSANVFGYGTAVIVKMP